MQIEIYIISNLTSDLPQTNYSKFHNIWSYMMIVQYFI